MTTTLTPEDWRRLAKAVADGNCTPFIGAGASHPTIELGGQIARRWAEECSYPLKDNSDLVRVAQYLALNPEGSIQDPLFPKQKFVDYLETCGEPDFTNEDEPYRGLAALPLPLYLTTNYDRFMLTGLKRAGRSPKMEYCRWHRALRDQPAMVERTFVPSVESPLVYHLHGAQDEPDSLVLTEDDYIDFIVNVSRDPKAIPAFVKAALTDNVLMFLGYSLSDWNFRVLFRSLQEYRGKSTRRGHVAVQLEPSSEEKDTASEEEQKLAEEKRVRAVRFLQRYFSNQHIVVFFGKIQPFVKTLRESVASLDQRQPSPKAGQPPRDEGAGPHVAAQL